mmetsp:Transcript_30399/g.50299  ORF Transcript_30399/g.50299 Transcript_30399/m.50299 type:complete len:228 (-) Transcript_30399:279-962(-)|eukprot:CAMPEP_0119327966 /NCGR_PEP_ID=MMETSP1333-20130426/72083_1 /TAXON_ID=418940 /ORGANISM="Scyphosphaera apsteinii, Strain RCC1455" /LENGTH=227 /DNA_ID=CAMNT_0007336697 /DNA_START=17 /DNA_END=700 /DNA_ORIENTATION=-
MAEAVLKTVVFCGSARNVTPPWGGDSRLGTRVIEYVKASLAARSKVLGKSGTVVKHTVTVFDPLEVFGEGGPLAASGCELTQPQFFLKPGDVPPGMANMKQTIADADCYVIVTAEYNHSVPPALLSMLDHFGGSCYAGKPSGIVTYSPSPWGGARASMSIQPVLHELGALPVSKMVHLPFPSDMLGEDGTPADPEHRMLKQLPAMLSQLEWMACAMKTQREATGLWS